MEKKVKKGKGKKRKTLTQEHSQDITTESEEFLCTQSKVVPSFTKKKKLNSKQPGANKIEKCELEESGQQEEISTVLTDIQITEDTAESTCKNTRENNYNGEDNIKEFNKYQEKQQKETNDYIQRNDRDTSEAMDVEPHNEIKLNEISESVDHEGETSLRKSEKLDDERSCTNTGAENQNITSPSETSTTGNKVKEGSQSHVTDEDLHVKSFQYVLLPPSEGMLEDVKDCLHDLIKHATAGLLPEGMSSTDSKEQELNFNNTNDSITEEPDEILNKSIADIPQEISSVANQDKEQRQKRRSFVLAEDKEHMNDDKEETIDCYDALQPADKVKLLPEEPKQHPVPCSSSDVKTNEEKQDEIIMTGVTETSVKEPMEKVQEEIPEDGTDKKSINRQQTQCPSTQNKEVEGALVSKGQHADDADIDMDITDSQLCEAVNVEESASQLKALQEIQKRHLEGRKIIHDLIVDLSYLNKLLLRTKREIETARRKRQPSAGGTTKSSGKSFEQRRF